ncbi:NAD-dependent epimerase/dehydratase family protein [Streptomyces justiciae]|uniref:NAD-dependent epimerase/dehydratase family protein n=1 Tax=Streptomyces justiciae TaxID=2780140 RepID=UPI0021186852|nr:NAD-dependent epimerase/dehydratase family protein [Streptomyces justiciae]MCW8382555.1 NAD-dependent epimerase/dehydratase family protein [Streptomyces justiciae]
MFVEDLKGFAAAGRPVLVTGATGYLGGHTVSRLLSEGLPTRVTIREEKQEQAVREALGRAGVEPGDKLEFAVASLDDDAGWAEAMAGVGRVLHLASPFPFTPPETEEELIRPARDGALRVIAAARAARVPRVVMTSSFAAVGYTVKEDNQYTESDWTDPDTEGLPAYHKSKVLAERAAWDYVCTEGGIELAVINPTGIFGPVLGNRPSASAGLVRAMLSGQMPVVPVMYFGVVDVRDVADLHLRAMLHPDAAGERFLGVSGPALSLFGMANILREHFPAAAEVLPSRELTIEEVVEAAKTERAFREAATLKGRIPVISNHKARSVLGWQPRDVSRTIVDTAESLIGLGLELPGAEVSG